MSRLSTKQRRARQAKRAKTPVKSRPDIEAAARIQAAWDVVIRPSLPAVRRAIGWDGDDLGLFAELVHIDQAMSSERDRIRDIRAVVRAVHLPATLAEKLIASGATADDVRRALLAATMPPARDVTSRHKRR